MVTAGTTTTRTETSFTQSSAIGANDHPLAVEPATNPRTFTRLLKPRLTLLNRTCAVLVHDAKRSPVAQFDWVQPRLDPRGAA